MSRSEIERREEWAKVLGGEWQMATWSEADFRHAAMNRWRLDPDGAAVSRMWSLFGHARAYTTSAKKKPAKP